MNLLRKLWAEEEGQTLVEYALIIALISLTVVAAMTFLRGKLREKYEQAGNTLGNVTPEATN